MNSLFEDLNMVYRISRSGPTLSRRGGFSLIELLVVLVILGLLAGLVGPRVMKYLGGAKTDSARQQLTDKGMGGTDPFAAVKNKA